MRERSWKRVQEKRGKRREGREERGKRKQLGLRFWNDHLSVLISDQCLTSARDRLGLCRCSERFWPATEALKLRFIIIIIINYLFFAVLFTLGYF